MGVTRILLFRLFFALLFVLPFVASNAQVAMHKDVMWGEPRIGFGGNGLELGLSINGETNVDPVSGLPLICFETLLEQWGGDSIDVRIVSAEYREATKQEDLVLNNVALPSGIEQHVFEEQKSKYLRILVSPYKKSGLSSHFLLMTHVSVSVSVHYSKVEARLLKSVSLSANNSVLSSGKWTKISVGQTGIHKISYSSLSSMGFSNPSAVKVFGQGGAMLPRSNDVDRIDDLTENAVWHHNNAIYFYAKGAVDWSYNNLKGMFTHKLHDFETKGYYFLSDVGEGKSVNAATDYNTSTPSYVTGEFDDYDFYEKEYSNLLSSGSRWLGERFGSGYLTSFDVSFGFPNAVGTTEARLSCEFVARTPTSYPSSFTTYLNGSTTAFQTVGIASVDMNASTGPAANQGISTKSFVPAGDNTSISIKYNFSTTNSAGYLDKIDIQVRRKLKMTGAQLLFRDVSSVGDDFLSRFDIETTDANTVIWDVTDYTTPMQMVLGGNGTTRWFVASSDNLREYVAFNPSGSLPAPEVVGSVSNQNLHGLSQTDYIMVTTPAFLSQANRLADFHRANSGLTVHVVTQEQVFNEFSSGCADITAIRSFVRMFYDRAGSNVDLLPKYLLLFGDGSFDNRSALKNNHVLTFQSDNSLNHTETYVSDDYYGFLDQNEGTNLLYDALDIGVGRLTAETATEATVLVDKVIYYAQKQLNSNWRKALTFVADDGDGNIHMQQADYLTQKVLKNHPEFDISKVFFDTYPKITTSGGQRYPDVNSLVDKAVTDGTLIFNYTGHGGPKQLADERAVDTESIRKWTNIDRLPLFVTATCEFSGYDAEARSAGEMVLLNPKGGGIALLSTTRVAWSHQNYAINDNFYTYALRKDAEGYPLRFGDICKLTKRATSGSVNKLNFSLLGDPALRLAANSLVAKITEVNSVPISESADTLKALSIITLSGVVADAQNNVKSDFNGKATVVVYDKEKEITTMGNNGAKPFQYKAYENLLFSGKVAVENGSFSLTFKMPKDIRYDVGNGRVSLYATNETLHAAGYNHQIKIGSYVAEGEDTDGPQLSLWLNSELFKDGDEVNSTPLLLAKIFDESGINTSNTGIGHDIVLLIDDGDNGRYVLNSYYESTLNDYRSGSIALQLPELAEGEHELSLRVWDNYNNSTLQTARFYVSHSSVLEISQMDCYPNPVKKGEDVHFKFMHNDPNSAIAVSCEVYSFNGLKVKSQKQLLFSSGAETEEFEVGATNGNGAPLSSGIYLFKFELVSETGKKAQFGQKIVVTM